MGTISHYGEYSEGLYGLPHMGEVIADYRKRSGDTQETFAIVCRVDKQTVAYWESQKFFADMDRRIFLCKVLGIPPALLGLTWRSVVDKEGSPFYIDSLEHLAECLSENAYGLYEDVLALAHTGPNKYSPSAIYRFHKHQQELEKVVKQAPTTEKDSWKDLLSRYYQHSAFIARNHKQEDQALSLSNRAVDMAISLEHQDAELLGCALYKRARIYLGQRQHDKARQDIQAALDLAERVRIPLKGSTYLLAAEINALYAENDEKLRTQCRKWQDMAATLLHKGKLEEDETFLWFNLYAVHHERAKMLTRFALFHIDDSSLVVRLQDKRSQADPEVIKDAHNALIAARKRLSMDLESMHRTSTMDFAFTEARLYLAERDFQESAKATQRALHIANSLLSQQGIDKAQKLYQILSPLDAHNPYVRSLGVDLDLR